MIDFLFSQYKDYSTLQIILEVIAVLFGLVSVWFAKKNNILVYPTGIVSTVIYIYLLYKWELIGDLLINIYYTSMSIYGWWNWSRKKENTYILPISKTNQKEKIIGLGFFALTIVITFLVYKGFNYTMQIPNYIDVVTSGVFFTAMWYMANKKLENWTLWIIGNLITIPLYAYRGLGMLSLQYIIFTILAIQGYLQWRKSLNKEKVTV